MSESAATVERGDSLGLYLSVPFCRSKCSFCNFASGVYPISELPRYVARLMSDLRAARARAKAEGLVLPGQVESVYFGGGTPSLLSGSQLAELFAAIHSEFTLAGDAEVTLEAAPAMLADEVLGAARNAGVTRISFGVQSFVDAEARAVGRLHRADEALRDIERARRAGMAVSVDLIAGLPGQTEASWRESLAALAGAGPEHASVYMLEVDHDSRLGGEMLLGGTRYGAGLTPSEDAVADFYSEACLTLAGAGLQQYEISNFAREGHASRHNLRYWQRRPYLGLGLDAHSMLRSASGEAVRFGTTDELSSYLAGGEEARGELHRLGAAEELEEAWFLGLRCNAGVAPAALQAEFGVERVEAFGPVLRMLVDDGLLEQAGAGEKARVRLTDRGRLLSNDVFAAFLGNASELESALAPAMAG